MKKFFATAASALLLLSGASAQSWSVEQDSLATILLDIDCPDDRTCFAGGAQDGIGPQIFATSNNGASYERAVMDPETAQMTFMTTASNGPRTAVTGGMGFGTPTQYTTDGKTFHNSDDWSLVAATQSIEPIKGLRNGYGYVGQFDTESGTDNGFALSTDGGKTWRTTSVPLGARARYGSFPSATHMVLSGGSWPRRDWIVQNRDIVEVSEGIVVERMGSSSKRARAVLLNDHLERVQTNNMKNGYKASIAVSTDGGRTFRETFFNDRDGFYFNGISCPTTTNCWVVAEGGGAARIMASTDGGFNWKTVWSATGGVQLMGLEFQSAREGWACGMKIVDGQFSGLMLHTTNGGQSWTEHAVAGQFCTSLSFSSPKNGHATSLNQYGTSSTLSYR